MAIALATETVGVAGGIPLRPVGRGAVGAAGGAVQSRSETFCSSADDLHSDADIYTGTQAGRLWWSSRSPFPFPFALVPAPARRLVFLGGAVDLA